MAKPLQSFLTLCDSMDCSPSGSSVQGILQAGTLEWISISFWERGKYKLLWGRKIRKHHGNFAGRTVFQYRTLWLEWLKIELLGNLCFIKHFRITNHTFFSCILVNSVRGPGTWNSWFRETVTKQKHEMSAMTWLTKG